MARQDDEHEKSQRATFCSRPRCRWTMELAVELSVVYPRLSKESQHDGDSALPSPRTLLIARWPHQVAPVVVCTGWSLPSARGCPSRSNPPAVRSPCRLVVALFQGSESGGCKCIALLRPPQRKRGNDGHPRFSSLFTTSAAGSRTDRCQGCPGFRSRHTSGSPVALSPWAGPSSAFLIDGPFIWGSICNLLTQDASLFLPPARRLHQPHPATGTLSEPVDEGFAFQDHAGQRETDGASSPSRNLMVLSPDTLDTPSLWLLLAGRLPVVLAYQSHWASRRPLMVR